LYVGRYEQDGQVYLVGFKTREDLANFLADPTNLPSDYKPVQVINLSEAPDFYREFQTEFGDVNACVLFKRWTSK